ncbi:hypothetical protein [Paenibacillus sp. YIM B09110]|uniref:hypothetical protein n=1 Tax=Paenibacillus sp. YIM B09110 TaxID=3126102 RepID=UPI00301E5879
MKKKIKGIAVALTSVMLVSAALAGCSSNNEKESGVKATNSPSNATNSGTSPTADPNAKVGKVSVMVYDRGTIPSSEGTMDNNRWTKWIQENAPFEEVKFIVVPRSEAPEKMNMLFAAGEGPDVVANYEDMLPFISKGQALEITDELLDKMPNYKTILDQYPALRKLTTVNGKLYTVGTVTNIAANHAVVIRADWLEKLNLEIPKTPEELFAVAKAFAEEDPDGNGKDDTYGLNLNTDAQRMLSHMFGYGNPEKYAVEDGKLTYVWDRMQDWLAYSKQFVDAKLVDPDFALSDANKVMADFLNGKTGIYFTGRFSTVNSSVFADFKKAHPDAKLDTFDLPATKYGSFTGYINGGPSAVGFINANTKDPDAAARFINWLNDPVVSDYLQNGPDGVYKKRDAEGTVVAVDLEKNKMEYDYASDYSIVRNAQLTGSAQTYDPLANEWYNQYLKSSDPITQEFGDLFFKMSQIANRPNAVEPRKWQQSMPALPSEYFLKKSNGNKAVDGILLKSLVTTSYTAEQAIADAKKAWKEAGGEDVDAFYNDYYQQNKDSMLSPADFEGLKIEPELLPSAKANSKIQQ